jgi:serine/threonine-protein kinase
MDGSVLAGRYQIEARIGSGGMAEVFRGFDPVLNRTVAIKVLHQQYSRDASFVARFRREAQAAARLNHPNIVGVYDTGEDDSTQFIVMEFIEGRTLAEVLATGRRPSPVQAAEMTQRVCAAITAAHAQGVIHRDIKPGNIMVTREGTVKVMDFGIARITTGVETAPQTSAVLGTASYLSPEQAQGQVVDARTDIYSLGAVLYEMLTGKPPFTGESAVAIAYKQVNETPPPPSQVNPDVPPRLDAVVMRALAKNPANRYQSAQDFASDLDRVVKGQEVEATPLLTAAAGAEATQVISRNPTSVLPPQDEPTGGGRKIWLGILIGVLVVAIVGGAGYLLVRSLTDRKEGDTLVSVPNVTGDRFGAARDEIEGLGLKVERENQETSDPSEVNIVLSQNPGEGARLSKDSGVVKLTVGVAQAGVEVPDLTGKTLGEAQTALSGVGLQIGSQQQESSSTIDAQHITRQSPASGESVPPGSLIDIWISTGPEMVSVPDVSTQCLSIGGARSALRAVGLEMEIGPPVADPGTCTNPSRVVAQDPASGTSVQAGSTVTVNQATAP